MGDKEERKKGEGRERKRREKVKGKGFSPLLPCAAEKNHQGTKEGFSIFKVFSLRFLPLKPYFYVWDINYIDSLIYFMKKVKAFEVLRFVFIPVLEHRFYTEMF